MSWPRPQPKSRIFSSPFIPSIKPQDPASGGHNSWKLAEDNIKSGGPCFNHSTCFSKPPPFAFNPLSVFLTLHHVFVDPPPLRCSNLGCYCYWRGGGCSGSGHVVVPGDLGCSCWAFIASCWQAGRQAAGRQANRQAGRQACCSLPPLLACLIPVAMPWG